MAPTAPQMPFADLFAGMQQHQRSLTEVIRSLNARGPVQSPLHKAELAMLDEALAKNKLDPAMHRLLTAKLRELQVATPVVERTVMMPAGAEDKTALNTGADKITLNPAGCKR